MSAPNQYDNAVYSEIDVAAVTGKGFTVDKNCSYKAVQRGSESNVKHSCMKTALFLLFLIVLALLLGTVIACIAFAVEVSKLKSETASVSSVQQQPDGLVDRIENLENLVEQFHDMIGQLDTSLNTQLNESNSAFYDRVRQLDTQVGQGHSALNDRIQELDTSLNIQLNESNSAFYDQVRQLDTQVGQGHSALNDRIRELDTSLNIQLNESYSQVRMQLRQSHSSLDERIQQLNTSLESGRHANVAAPSCPALPPSSPSGYYWVRSFNGSPVRVYCDMTRSCDGVTGGWMRVAELNMADPSQQCPSPWVVANSPGRSCTAVGSNCHGRNFITSGVTYDRVCGRAIGYGLRTLDAFSNRANINGAYLDGISVTHGQPRQHIWSFAGSHDRRHGVIRCPCDNPNHGDAPLPPSFVGNNYFCDGEYNGALWDGVGCTSSCCTFNSPPWFSVILPAPASDDIEVRICANSDAANEDIHLRLLELYVQ